MDFAATVQRQRAFFQSGATRPLEFRRAQLRKLHDALVAHEPALLAALHADLRKSPHEAYTTEIGLVLSELRHALRHLPAWMKPRRRRTPLAGMARARIHPAGTLRRRPHHRAVELPAAASALAVGRRDGRGQLRRAQAIRVCATHRRRDGRN